MSHSLFIATMEPHSGKSLIALGVMELLSRRVNNLGFFRPVVKGGTRPDNDIELVRSRYCPGKSYDTFYGVTYKEARQLVVQGNKDLLLKRVLQRFKQLEQQCEFVLCEGTDYTGVVSAFEFDFNAEMANHLGCALLLVTHGRQKTAEEVVGVCRTARSAFVEQGCAMTATLINRVNAGDVAHVSKMLSDVWEYNDPVFVIPEHPMLTSPTVAEIAEALDAQPVYETAEAATREVFHCKIAAMHLSNCLTNVEQGGLLITPGDRTDVILGSLASVYSENYPNIAGMILSDGLEPSPSLIRLVEGLPRLPVPIYLVPDDTYTVAMKVNAVRGVIAPHNERKIATALGVFESAVDTAKLAERIGESRSTRVTPLMFEYELIERAKADRQRIVLPEGRDERILRAAERLLRRGVVDLTLLGDQREIRERAGAFGLQLEGAELLDPAEADCRHEFAQTYFELRRHKGITEDVARDVMLDVSYFGTMMVHRNLADGMVSGAVHTTAHTIRPAFEIIRTVPGCALVSSVFFMCLEDRVLVYGDCAVNPNPTPEQLAHIALSSAKTAAMFGIVPRVAMLSYSTGESGKGADVDSVREATRIARELRPDLRIEGPIQYDAAVDASVARTKLPQSDFGGQATVFIFPDLNTGNNTYKAVQRSAGAVAIGPVMQGLNRPVNDLSRGCTVTDIVNTVAITAIQAQSVRNAM